MKLKFALIASCLTYQMVACDVPIDLDLDQSPPIVSIEALLTDRPGKQYVRITMSTNFYNQQDAERVTNATVVLRSDVGETTAFSHYAGTSKDSAGYYFPPIGYAGQIDRTYTLTVAAAGKTFEATDKLVR